MTVGIARRVVRPLFSATELKVLAADFDRTSFVQAGSGWAGPGLAEYAGEVFRAALDMGEQVATPHRVENGALLGGARFLRLDPGHPGLDEQTRPAMAAACRRLGAAEFFGGMRDAARELTDCVLPRYGYERGYFLAYRPGDYLRPHDDRSTGDRVNVQMPVTVGGYAALRTLGAEGFLEPHPDELGTLRILGPTIWHDVPPLITLGGGFRVVFSLRFRRRARSAQ